MYIDNNIQVFLNSIQYKEITEKYNVKLIYIGGSRLTDLQTTDSDYDICIIKDDDNQIVHIDPIYVNDTKMHFYIWDIKEIPYNNNEFFLGGMELNGLDESKIIELTDNEFGKNFKKLTIPQIIDKCCKKFGYTFQLVNEDLIKQYNINNVLDRIGKSNYYIMLCYYAINRSGFGDEEKEKILKIKTMRPGMTIKQELLDWFIERVAYVNNGYESLDKNI